MRKFSRNAFTYETVHEMLALIAYSNTTVASGPCLHTQRKEVDKAQAKRYASTSTKHLMQRKKSRLFLT